MKTWRHTAKLGESFIYDGLRITISESQKGGKNVVVVIQKPDSAPKKLDKPRSCG